MDKIHIFSLTWNKYKNNMDSMMSQTDIANYFRSKYGTKIDQARVSRITRGKEPVPYGLAKALSKEFPWRTLEQWKENATPEDLKRAFEQLKTDGEAA